MGWGVFLAVRRSSSALTHNQVVHVLQTGQTSQTLNQKGTLSVLQRSPGDIRIRLTNSGDDRFGIDTKGLQKIGIQRDTDLLLRPPFDFNRSHPGEPFKFRPYYRFHAAQQFVRILPIRSGDGQAHHRQRLRVFLSNVQTRDIRIRCVPRHFFLHVEQGEIHIRVPFKFRDHHGLPGARH